MESAETAETGKTQITPFIKANNPGYEEIREYGDMVLERLDNWSRITESRPVSEVEEAQLNFMLRQFMDMVASFYINSMLGMLSRRQGIKYYSEESILSDIRIEMLAS